MTLSASELYEAGLALPASVRKDVALRLLDSIGDDQASVDDAWTGEIASRVDDLLSGRTQTVSGEQVFAELAAGQRGRC